MKKYDLTQTIFICDDFQDPVIFMIGNKRICLNLDMGFAKIYLNTTYSKSVAKQVEVQTNVMRHSFLMY